ncbi:MAG: phycobiliprotein lyase [Pseudanabaenaceae cyanobacterium bins.39]|nr:phycobiliprotein lyase [Pseudanabaenaceae cyanobacterium bins.39]
MDIYKFLELFVGRWRSQRSDHQFGQENGNDSRSVLDIKFLEADQSEVVGICQKFNIDLSLPELVIRALHMSWEEESLSSNKPKGQTMFVVVFDKAIANQNIEEGQTGIVLSALGKGHFTLSADESLTIQTETEQGKVVERIWYGNPNLRFRVATVLQDAPESDQQNLLVQSSKFYSEIRVSSPQ